jgi:hypothetical protein
MPNLPRRRARRDRLTGLTKENDKSPTQIEYGAEWLHSSAKGTTGEKKRGDPANAGLGAHGNPFAGNTA